MGIKNWVFFGVEKGRIATLFSAQSVKICRHLKIQNKANPFDTKWKSYFENRERDGQDMRCRIIKCNG